MGNIVAPNTTNIQTASQFLKQGELVGIPTETVYGLAADANQPQSIKRVFDVKKRPSKHPLIVHIYTTEQLNQWASNIPSSAFDLAQAYWPGPLTMILPKHPQVSSLVTGNQPTIALRLPNQPITQSILAYHDLAVVAPSANLHCQISPTQAQHLAPIQQQLAMIIDGGQCSIGVESTIIDLTQTPAAVLRLGAISAHDLSQTLDQKVNNQAQQSSKPTPGNLKHHYAPQTPALLMSAEALHNFIQQQSRTDTLAIMSWSQKPCNFQGLWFQMPNQDVEYARCLYNTLHQADQYSIDAIIIQKPYQQQGLWPTIQDRLYKACSNNTTS